MGVPAIPGEANALLLQPGYLGPLETANRLVRSGTSETMASPDGQVTDELISLYSRLAEGGVGTIFTGHLYSHPRGQYARRQTGIHSDALIPGLRRLADAVHGAGGLILAQVAHAGSQSRVPQVSPLAPSAVPNALTGRMVEDASAQEVSEAVEAFADGAGRAIAAGFDGVHIHGANGYLISEFLSPLTNRREDEWGGARDGRFAFPLAVVRAVRERVPQDRALTMKIGFQDAPSGGLSVEDGVRLAGEVVRAGVDAIEVSCGVMAEATDSCAAYVAVDRRRAIEDLLPHRILASEGEEAYFVPWARALREQVSTTVVAVGGMRRTETMVDVLQSGDADFIAMARPFIREPDLAAQIAAGRTGRVDCTSCNLCLRHEGHHSLRCWRTPRSRLAHHAAYRFAGGFMWGPRGD